VPLHFVVSIPPQFERDLRAGRNPSVLVSIDATAMQQAGLGAGYIKSITNDRISSFLERTEATGPKPVQLVVRRLFNRTPSHPGSRAWWPSSIRSAC